MVKAQNFQLRMPLNHLHYACVHLWLQVIVAEVECSQLLELADGVYDTARLIIWHF